ncbi:MAG: hypothetical protein AAFY24_01960 [Pseudomonadota bacterium]
MSETDEQFLSRIQREHQELLDSMSGKDRLSRWFGLSYASWLTMPRSFMQQMPDEWQRQMAILLEQYDDALTWPEDLPSSYVVARKDNRFTSWPDWVVNYRRGDPKPIRKMMEPTQ